MAYAEQGKELTVVVWNNRTNHYWLRIKVLKVPSKNNEDGKYTVLVLKVHPKTGESKVNLEGQVIELNRKTVHSPGIW